MSFNQSVCVCVLPQEDEELRSKEEEEAREHEEYLKLKEAFTVDEEGTHEAELSQDVSNNKCAHC